MGTNETGWTKQTVVEVTNEHWTESQETTENWWKLTCRGWIYNSYTVPSFNFFNCFWPCEGAKSAHVRWLKPCFGKPQGNIDRSKKQVAPCRSWLWLLMDNIRSWRWLYPFIHHNLLGNRIRLVQLMLRRIGLEHMWTQVSLPISIGFSRRDHKIPLFVWTCYFLWFVWFNFRISEVFLQWVDISAEFLRPVRRSARPGLGVSGEQHK